MDLTREVSPAEVAQQAESGELFLLLDVRNPWEYEICHIEGSVLVPLGQLPGRVAEIGRDRRVVVYCHHGQRSLMAAEFLRQEGYDAVSMAGGIELWAQEVEPDMARY
jgi:rhodanese-related sulfurtransferase